jgi:predicted kinase
MDDPLSFYFAACAAAYVRGKLAREARMADTDGALFEIPLDRLVPEDHARLIRLGQAAGLRLHRFKRTMGLPRVARVLGILRGLAPTELLDVGSGRGAFLWPLLDAFPALSVTIVEQDPVRVADAQAVHEGGMARLAALHADTTELPLASESFDVATMLEVLEHIPDAQRALHEVVRVTRQILWRSEEFLAMPVPFAVREVIVSLVRLHGLPLYLLDEANPQRAIIRASQIVRCDRLALLAEADARGRRCDDQQELLARVELFRGYAREQRCLEGPRAFPSDHGRFLYFHQEHEDPDYRPYDDARCTVTLMVGLPGAGKDTYIQRHLPHAPVISLDALRHTLGVAAEDEQAPVIAAAMTQARAYLRAGQDFVWNATNVTRRMRARLIGLFTAYGARTRIVYVETPFPVLLRRNATRARPVPDAVIRRLADALDMPDPTEAHVVEWVADSR